jgi:hypothetical protein
VGTGGFHKQGTQPDLVSMCLKDSAADVMRCECGNISKTGGYCVDRGSGKRSVLRGCVHDSSDGYRRCCKKPNCISDLCPRYSVSRRIQTLDFVAPER